MSNSPMVEAEMTIRTEIDRGSSDLMSRLLDRFMEGDSDQRVAFAAALIGRVVTSEVRLSR